MPKGKFFGLPRVTSIGPFVESKDDVLYHFTRKIFIEEILQSGFTVGYNTINNVLEDFPLEETSGIRGALTSHRDLEHFFDVYKPENKSHIPDREGSTFFFPTKDKPQQKIESLKESDLEELSNTARIFGLVVKRKEINCIGARGNYALAKRVNEVYHNKVMATEAVKQNFAKGKRINPTNKIIKENVPEEAAEAARRFWESVKIYDGYANNEHEVWYRCNIQPEAIEAIIDLTQ